MTTAIKHQSSTEIDIQDLYQYILEASNQEYFIERFKKFDLNLPQLSFSLNWVALLFPGPWSLHKKMYGWFSMWLVIRLSLLNSIQYTNASETELVFGILIFLSIINIIFAMSANSLYHRKIRKIVTKAQQSIENTDELIGYLNKRGKSLNWLRYVGYLLSGPIGPIGFLGLSFLFIKIL